MRIKCLASGSSGNCYVLTNKANEMLLLDVGIKTQDIKVGVGFNIIGIVGAIVTHSHN